MRYIFAIAILIFCTTSTLYADTVIMKNKTRIKGLIVDEYIDRVTLNTIYGEKDIFRKDIERVEYDTPEQNFMQLGRSYDDKGWYDKAAFYYKKAMEINPGYKEAREAYLASHAKMWRKEEKMAESELKRQSMVMNWRRDRNKKPSSADKGKRLLLKSILGISLLEKDGVFAIDEVAPYSSAAKAGIQKGDALVGIWGRLVRYSDMENVIDELVGPKYSEVKVLIKREISVSTAADEKGLYKELGILLGFKYEGLTINDVLPGKKGEVAGFKKGDMVIAIDKNLTRYMPLDSVIALVNSSRDKGKITFTIRRNINLRREGNNDSKTHF